MWVIIPVLCRLSIRKDSGKMHFLISELVYRFARGCVRVRRLMWVIPTRKSYVCLCDSYFRL